MFEANVEVTEEELFKKIENYEANMKLAAGPPISEGEPYLCMGAFAHLFPNGQGNIFDPNLKLLKGGKPPFLYLLRRLMTKAYIRDGKLHWPF